MGFSGDNIHLRTGEQIPLSALEFTTSRGGGPGGQHVNKVETRVEVRLNLEQQTSLRERTREILLERLASRLDKDGTLRIVASTERSQYANKTAAIRRLEALLNKALTPVKKRIATKPSGAAKRRRLDKKKKQSEKKATRRWKPGRD